MGNSVKKEAIMNAAESLFYNHGFHSVGLKKILQEAQAALMTLYHHFSSKEALILEILKRREAQYLESMSSHVQNSDSDGDVIQAVIKAHGIWLKNKGHNGCLFLRAMQEFAGINEDIVHYAKQHKQSMLSWMTDLFREFHLPGHKTELKFARQQAVQVMFILEGMTSMAEIVGANKAIKQAKQLGQELTLRPWCLRS